MRLFGWFRKDPNAPPPPDLIKPHHWLRTRMGKVEKAPPRWVQRLVRCKPTYVDRMGRVTLAVPTPNPQATMGVEFLFKELPDKFVRMWFEPVNQEESDYLETKVDFYLKQQFREDQSAFLSFAGFSSQGAEAYQARFPRPKAQAEATPPVEAAS